MNHNIHDYVIIILSHENCYNLIAPMNSLKYIPNKNLIESTLKNKRYVIRNHAILLELQMNKYKTVKIFYTIFST